MGSYYPERGLISVLFLFPVFYGVSGCSLATPLKHPPLSLYAPPKASKEINNPSLRLETEAAGLVGLPRRGLNLTD